MNFRGSRDRRMIGVRILLRVALLALAAGGNLSARSIAVVMGIPDFLQDFNTPAIKFADHDAELFRRKIATNFQVFHIGNGKGMFSANAAVNQALFQARAGDTVFLFLSTRGIARPGAQDGYIGLADLVTQKKESTAIKLSYLLQLIEQSEADRVIIFADLCREPALRGYENRINVLMAELSAKSAKPVGGILATGPRQASKEDENLTAEGSKGFGVFGYYLVNSGETAREGIALPKLFSNLLSSMPEVWQRSQRPRQFGSPTAAATPLWRVASALGFPSPVRQFQRRVLLASASAAPLYVGAEQAETQAAEIGRLLDDPQPIRDPQGVAQSVRELQPAIDAVAWEELRTRAVGRLGDDGQRCVARFGTQDLLPEDPLRVQPSEFARCAQELAAAGTLVPTGVRFDGYRNMLRIRELFCRSRANPAGAFDLLRNAALAAPDYVIAEVEDTLGVLVMQSGQPERLARAREYFEAAKRSSPEWLYPRHNLALLYAEQGDMRSAEREYRQALALPHPQPYVYYNYGLVLQRLNRPSEALRVFRQALAAYDDAIKELSTRSTAWANSYPQYSALSGQRAVIFRKAKAEVYNALASLLERRDEHAALDMYEEAIRWDRSLCPPVYNFARLGSTLSPDLARLDDLRKRLEGSLPGCPKFTPSRLLLGALDLRRGQIVGARQQFVEILTYDRTSTAALLGLSSAEDSDGNAKAAIEWLDKAVASMTTPGSGAAGGRIMTTGGGPANLQLYRELAEQYRTAGRWGECRLTYQLAVATRVGKAPRRDLQSILALCSAGK